MPESHGDQSFWRRLTGVERAAFAQVATRRRYPKGAALIQTGATDRWLAVIWSGRVRVIGSGSQVIATRDAGDVIGEQALIDGKPRSATVVAETPVSVLVFDGVTLKGLLASFPRVQQQLTTILSERLRELDERLAGRTGEAFDRIVRHLVEQVDGQAGAGPAGRTVHIGSQSALGARLGVSRDSVVRTLGRLRGDGLVTTGRGWVVVRDLAALRGLVIT